MKKITRTLGALGIAGAMLLMSACSSSEAGNGGDSGIDGAEVLKLGVSADIVETLPSAIAQFNTRSIMSNMFDQLVRDPVEGTVPEPMLATEWEVSEDRMTYTFTLRDDVVFHDGAEFTAEDAAFSLSYAKTDPNTEGELASVESVEAQDDTTLVIQMYQPQPDLLMALTDPGMGIIPKDFGGKSVEEFRAAPVGTGPFVFGERTVGTDVRFDRNDAYWGEVAHVAGLHFKVFADVNAEAIALQSGEIDIASNIPLDSVSLMEGEVFVSAPQLVEILQINSNTPILQNVDFRRALSMGMDREDIVSNLLGGYGEVGASNLSVTSFPNGDPEIPDSPYGFDADEATKLVSGSGYDGTPLRLIYSTGIPTDVSIASALQAQWKKVGIEIDLTPLESGEWLKAVTAASPHDAFDLSISRAGGATATPQWGFMKASQYYGGGWPTEDVDAAVAAYGAAADLEAEQQALLDYEARAAQELQTAPIASMGVVWVVNDNVSGLQARASQFFALNTVKLG